MYGSVRFHISRNRYPALFDYCAAMTGRSKNLRNAVLFRMRQWFTSCDKKILQPMQEEVRKEVWLTCEKTGRRIPGKVISYYFMDKLLRVTENPDYFSGLPMQSAQAIAKETVTEFKNWLKALSLYRKEPGLFTGRPKIPGYTRGDHRILTLTNQDCVVYEREDGSQYLKLPLTKETLDVRIPEGAVLKEVKLKPYYSDYEIVLVYEQKPETGNRKGLFIGGIDLGVENIIAFVGNDGEEPILYKGGALKSRNQFCNKQKAKYTGILMKGHDPKKVHVHTRRLDHIERKRSAFLRDEMHRISARLIRECVRRGIGTLVIGKNVQWKTGSSMGRKTNQSFVQIPHSTLIWMIRYKAEREGIEVFEQEESYTSQASFLDHDEIPVYGNETEHSFSGRRIKRGLYRSKDGTVFSADVNGSANIIRKAVPNAFEGINDYGFLQKVKTVRFRDLHPCRG